MIKPSTIAAKAALLLLLSGMTGCVTEDPTSVSFNHSGHEMRNRQDYVSDPADLYDNRYIKTGAAKKH